LLKTYSKNLTYLKSIFITVAIIFSLIIIALIFQYLINVKYKFPEPHSFKGALLFNPYQDIDSSKWLIANFHAHTHKFPGNKKINEENSRYLDSIYTLLGYNVVSISDYQMINPFERKHEWYIPVYEHGYQYYKNHHLVLNAKKVSWLDYIFRQTLSNKQFVINSLKKDSSVVLALVHPHLREALSFNDFKYLSNYNCLEIVDSKFLFTEYFDAALSSGHQVFLMADDDVHNLKNPYDYGSCFNLINSVPASDSILHALKNGRSMAVKLNLNIYKSDDEKKNALNNLLRLLEFRIKNDTIFLRLSKSVSDIKFIGQKGVIQKRIANKSSAYYSFTKEDTYIRTEIECMDGTRLYLNPVFRYNGHLESCSSSPVDVLKTLAGRVILALLILTSSSIIYFRRKYV